MNDQTAVIEDLDRFRDMLRILAAGLVSGATPAAVAKVGDVSSMAR